MAERSRSGKRTPCAILGSGNIGTDLMAKLARSDVLELTAVVGIDAESDGLARARKAGFECSAEGIEWILGHPDECTLVFDATSAAAIVRMRHYWQGPGYRQST